MTGNPGLTYYIAASHYIRGIILKSPSDLIKNIEAYKNTETK